MAVTDSVLLHTQSKLRLHTRSYQIHLAHAVLRIGDWIPDALVWLPQRGTRQLTGEIRVHDNNKSVPQFRYTQQRPD